MSVAVFFIIVQRNEKSPDEGAFFSSLEYKNRMIGLISVLIIPSLSYSCCSSNHLAGVSPVIFLNTM